MPPDCNRSVQGNLIQFVNEVRWIAPWCKPCLLVGEPADRIASLARDSHTDLIVIASYIPRLQTKAPNLHRGVNIVRKARCPVLVYPDGKVTADAVGGRTFL
jgi:thiol-disulfide isomerase/thioredoxin